MLIPWCMVLKRFNVEIAYIGHPELACKYRLKCYSEVMLEMGWSLPEIEVCLHMLHMSLTLDCIYFIKKLLALERSSIKSNTAHSCTHNM